MEKPFVTIENVSKIFQTRNRSSIAALKDINMQFGKGGFVSIVGPSGCGKSTIIRMIDDIIKPTAGAITVDGFTYDNNVPISKERVQKMGFIFQAPNLYPWFTVKQNVMLPLKIYGKHSQEYDEVADRLLDSVNMLGYADAYPAEISGGMSQRIGVIRGMVHEPEILMMDEPYGALDESTREQLNMELLKIWKDTGMTIIFITHNVEEAVLLSERVYVMESHPGRIVAEINIEFDQPRTLGLLTEEKFGRYCMEIENLIGKIDLSKVK
ncbi:MAG: ABC transporter ATP-binding protein [Clostridiales Family XIII bacterium]|nr:ABC transporter ATP-binding protein [Clostridiales Family XIII bacterium]